MNNQMNNRRLILISLFIILFAQIIFSEDLRISVHSNKQLEVFPRENITISIAVKNLSNYELDLVPEVSMNNNWKLIIPDSSFSIKPGEESIS